MKIKSVSRLKILLLMLPILSVAFCAVSSITGGDAEAVFTPPEIVDTISDMEKPPETGTPLDYTPEENMRFANWIIYNSGYFEGEAVGTCKADLGFTKYTQNVRNSRKVKNKTVFAETVSTSSLVSVAEQKYITPKNIALFRPSEKVRGENVTWSDSVYPMSTDSFFSKYGAVPREITKYSVTEESIKSAKLLSFGSNEFVYEFELFPESGGKYFKNEIRTLAGASQDPEIHSMVITVTMDSNWIAKSVLCVDTYGIAIPVLGSMQCLSTMNETFANIGADMELAESELFEQYLPEDGDNINDTPVPPEEKSASAYLAEAFEPYLGGENLNLDISLGIAGGRRNIKLGLDIADMNVNVLVDDALYIGYDNTNVYIGAGALKGYLPVEAAKELDLASLGIDLGAFGEIDFAGMLTDDIIGALFADSDLTKENGLVTINLKFNLAALLKDGSEFKDKASKIALDVDLILADGEKAALSKIDATVNIGLFPIKVNISPVKELFFPDTADYESLEGLVGFAAPIANTLRAEAFALDVTADIASEKFTDTISAKITLNRDLTLSGNISLAKLGMDANIVCDGESVYAKCGNVKIKLDLDSAADLKDAFLSLLADFGVQLPEMPQIDIPSADTLLDKIVNLDLKDLIAHIEEFSIKGNSLRVAVNYGGCVYAVTLSHNGEHLTTLVLDEFEADGVKLAVTAKLDVSDNKAEIAKPDGEYIDACDLVGFVSSVASLADTRGFVTDFEAAVICDDGAAFTVTGQLTFLAKADGLAVQLNLSVPQTNGENMPIMIAFEGTDVYLVYGETKIHADKSDADALGGILSSLLPAFTPNLIKDIQNLISSFAPSSNPADILKMIADIRMIDGNTLEVDLTAGANNVNIRVTLADGRLSDVTLTTVVNDEKLGTANINARLSVKTVYDAESVENASLAAVNLTYVEASELIPYLDALINTFRQKTYRVSFDDIRVWYADKTHKVNGYVEFSPTGGIPNLHLAFDVYEVAATGVDADFTGVKPLHVFDIMITDGDGNQEIYLTYNGVKFKLTVDEVLSLLGNVKDVLGIKDGTIIDRIIPADREIVSGDFIGDFQIDAFDDISVIADGLLEIITQIYDEAYDFVNDADYDYKGMLGKAQDILNRLTSLLDIKPMPDPTLSSVLDMLGNLPKITLYTAADETSASLNIGVNETSLSLTRSLGENSILTNWSMENLVTQQSATTFRLSLQCPESVEIERPVYHDYNYATSIGGTYKRQELIDRIRSGGFDGVSLPNYDSEFVRHDVSYGEDDIIKANRYERKWLFGYKYNQKDNGDYIKLRSGDYSEKADFIEKIKNLTYVEYNGEYWTYTDFFAFKNTVNDNGNFVSLDGYFNNWFENTYGMPYETYFKTYLEGNCLNDLSDVSNLTTALLNTANLSDFHIKGNLNVVIDIKITKVTLDVPVDIRVKLIPVIGADGKVTHKPLVAVSMSTPETKKLGISLLERSASQIYYLDGYMYFNKLDQSGKYNYVKVAAGDLMNEISGDGGMNNLMNYVFYVAPMTGMLKDTITDQMSKGGDTEPGNFEDFFNHYYFKDNRHFVQIDLASLAGNTNLGKAEVFIGTRKTDIGNGLRTFINELGFTTSMVGVVTMKFEATLADIGTSVDTFRVATGFNGNTPIYEERPIESLKSYLDSHSYGTITNPVQE